MKGTLVLLFLVGGMGVFPVRAQTDPEIGERRTEGSPLALSLGEAVARALRQSEEIGLARAQLALAEAGVRQAASARYPQVSGDAGYTRTIQSVFDTGFALPDTLRFDPDASAPLEERVRYLEQNVPNAAFGALGGLFTDLPFGQENVYAATVSGSQLLFAPQVGARVSAARHFRQAVQYRFSEEQADVRLHVEEAYFRAQLAHELVTISEAAIAQAQAFLEEERLRRDTGRVADLDVLRAEVTMENLRPALVEAQNAAEVALLDLKRLTNIPFSQPLVLTTPLTPPPPEALAEPALDPEAVVAARAAIRAAREQVALQQAQVRLERAAFLPRMALQASYGRQLFADRIFGFGGAWRPDFTVGVGVQIPIFSGFQRQAAVAHARAELDQARYRLQQLREAVYLQVEQALFEKRRAHSLLAARQRTVAQAEEVYRLTTLQYEEGVATQLEVSQSRLALLQARSNLARALADFYLAEARLVRLQVTPAVESAQPVLPEGLGTPDP